MSEQGNRVDAQAVWLADRIRTKARRLRQEADTLDAEARRVDSVAAAIARWPRRDGGAERMSEQGNTPDRDIVRTALLESFADSVARGRAGIYGRREDALQALDRLAARVAELEAALREVHEFHCGCDRPGNPVTCVATPVLEYAALAESPDRGEE
jgi:hypothetical protein